MAVVPLLHPDSTVPARSAPYWLIPVLGARSGPSDSITMHAIMTHNNMHPHCKKISK